ncbi:AAA family ATPase [Flavobacterium sp. LBUM151]
MEIRHLRLIKAIVEEGSITKAIDKLHLTQSALSHQLKEAEYQLGTAIFLRMNKKLVLTKAGEKIYELANEILDKLAQTETQIKQMVFGEHGEIRISTECFSSYHWLPHVLKQFHLLYPNVELKIVTEATHIPLQKLLDKYQIVRNDENVKVFHTLSEGEKMIISFLYFIEQCRGKKNAGEVNKKRIVVIDDPISSLSHVYVFNVGRLIHNEFLRSEKYEQIFILTHSLYFFYELTDTNKERRNEKQKLFRLRKNSEGSEILEMNYEEIQNDYHSYWSIINDNHQQPALIANCMRNIIEYFYNFVEKKDLNNVFQKRELQENRFDAFNRFMNRESHSLGQNIFDYKEFNYQDFKDAFQLVFKETGYENHYNKMIRI